MWESFRSERFDPFLLWRVVGEDMQLLSQVVHLFASEYPSMLRDIENAARAQDGMALRKASHKLKGSLLQFAAPVAVSAAAELEHCADNGGMEKASACIATVKKETEFLIQILQVMVSHQRTAAETERES